ncbi:hypothetical protein [Roseibium aggregatum]|uniref:Uncharacterized protein n=1 Tax=Roseibium aggregatum TaxID=187304 RepID=A0A939E9F0_9HYPH|nr:hypothetical protein [Roseibium aggregatum]MBN9669301.1 hypothetical protein [Roseibium aggregatum]
MTEAQGTSAEIARVHLAHATDGRARLRLTGRISPEHLAGLCERLAHLPGVTRCLGRPNTGSLIVEARLKKAELTAMLKESGIVEFVPHGAMPPMGLALRFGLLRTDQEIASRSGGQFSLHTAFATILLIGAAVQLARGRIAGPALTLLFNALSLLETADPKER